MSLYLSKERYLAALIRVRGLIASGLKFIAYDDTTIGSKNTECSWGLCSESKKTWPDPEDHLWPKQFVETGRSAPKYLQDKHQCPFDRREKSDGNGCFYSCLYFQHRIKPTREEALALYDRKISLTADPKLAQPKQ